MPTPPALAEARRKALADSGFNPDQYDFNDDTGEVFPRSAPPAPATSLLGTIGAHALSNIPEAAVGLGGAGLGSVIGGGLGALGGPAAPVTVPVGSFLGGLAGGFIAPSVAEPALAAAKQTLLPQGAQDYLAQSAQEHPYGAQGGAILSQLVGLKPSLSNISKMGSGARSLAGGVPWSRLSAAQRGGLLNVPIGAAIGGGVDVAQQLNSNEPFDPTKAALSTAGGALFTQPNRLAQRYLGMHPTPNETAVPLRQAPDMDSPAYRDYVGQLGISQGADVQYRPQVLDDAGNPVAGRFDPGKTPQDFGLAQISEAIGEDGASHDTAPHELVHNMIAQLKDGSPAEQTFLKRALEQVAGDHELLAKLETTDPEEALTQLAGEIFSGRMSGSKKYSGLIGDLGALFKDRFLRRATSTDHARLLANILQRQGALADRGTPPINLPPSPDTTEGSSPTVSPDTLRAFRESGFGDVKSEDVGPLFKEIQDAISKGPKQVKTALTKAQAALARQRQLLAAAPDDASRQSISESVNKLERKINVLENGQRFLDKSNEIGLGSRTGEAPPEPAPERDAPLDTGERTHPDTGFQGWEPEPTVEPPLKQPTEDAAWEREGGEYPQPSERPRPDPKGTLTRAPIRARADYPPGMEVEPGSPEGRSIVNDVQANRGVPAAQAVEGYGNDNPETRYQRFGANRSELEEIPKRSRNPLAGEATKLESGGTQDHRELAKSFRELYDQRRANMGRYANPLIGALEELDKKSRDRVYATLIDERRVRASLRNRLTTPAEQSAYDQIRSTLKLMASDQQRAGQPVWDNGVARQRGIDPWYAPNIIDAGVRRALAEGPGTQYFQRLKSDFIAHQIQNGRVSAAEAEKRFGKLLGTFSKSAAGNPFDFNAVRIQQGFGLPDSWIEKDAIKALRGYSSAFSRDRASWDVLEKDPHTMRRLGSNYYAGDQQIPSTVTAHNLSRDPSVQNMTADFMGHNTADEPFISGASRLGSALIIGNPYVKIADIITTPFKAIGMSAKGHGLSDVIKGIFHTPEGVKNALSTGLNRAGGLVVAHDILGFGEEANTRMVQAAEALTKYSGAEWLEKFSRGVSQAIGEMQGQTYQRLAAQGDAKAIEFLRKLNATPSMSAQELGTRIAQIYQGRYDATNMPHWFSHGKMAPFVGLLRWSAEQTNNFNKFCIEPARKGDFRPAIVSLLGGLTGGLLINEIREKVSGKKAYTASWAELAAGRGKPGEADAIAYKLLAAAQVTGTAGLLSELVKQSYELLSGRSPQGYNFPALNIAGDTSQRVFEAIRSIGEGEDAGRVIAKAAQDTLAQNVQAYKLLRNNLGRLGVDKNAEYELNKANQTRDLSTWQRMEGKDAPAPIKPKIDYTRLGEQEFDRSSLQDAAKAAPGLIKDAIAKAHGDPAEMQKRLAALHSIKSFGMPDPKSSPLDFAKYSKWLRDTKGPEEANRVTKEFITRSATDKAKRQLIPAFHTR